MGILSSGRRPSGTKVQVLLVDAVRPMGNAYRQLGRGEGAPSVEAWERRQRAMERDGRIPYREPLCMQVARSEHLPSGLPARLNP